MSISKYDDVIDSRDIIERIEELGEELADKLNNVTKTENWNSENLSEGNYQFMVNSLPESDKDDIEEYWMLVALAEECEQYSSDWEYSESLIRYSYFEEYMDEMIENCYELPKDMPYWMSIKLDYEALKQDYTEVEFDDIIYYIRSC